MERRALIALALSFVVFMAFIFFGEKMKHPVAPAPQTQTAAQTCGPGPASGGGATRTCPRHRRRCGRRRPGPPRTWWWTPPCTGRYSPNWGPGSRASN